MQCSEQHQSPVSVRLLTMVCLFTLFVAAIAAQAQTYTVIHNFTGGSDGDFPTSTLVQDRAGNLYGTTNSGGTYDAGVVYQLKPGRSGGWVFYPIHEFNGWNNGDDGANPLDYGGLTIGPDGDLYGSTEYGGIHGCDTGSTCGVV